MKFDSKKAYSNSKKPLKFMCMRAHPRYWLLYLGMALAYFFIQILPYKTLLKIGKIFGYFGFIFSRRRRLIGLKNIQVCFPEKSQKEQEILLKQCFLHVGQGFIEMLMVWWMPESKFKKIIFDLSPGMREKIQEQIQSGQGVILCGGHFTSLEMLGCEFGLRYKNLYLVYQKHKDPVIEHIINKGRSRYAKGLIERTDLKKMIKILRQGDFLWYAPDQDLGRHASVFVNFFNTPCATVRALGSLLKAGKAACFFSFFYREDLDQKSIYKVMAFKQEQIPTGDDQKDAEIYNQALEQIIREHPAQYLWLHRRFKTRPSEQDKKFYDF